jgi:hypothetical protein
VGNWDVEEDCWRVVEGGVDWTASQQLPKTDHHRDQSCNNYEEKALAVMTQKKTSQCEICPEFRPISFSDCFYKQVTLHKLLIFSLWDGMLQN